MKYNLYLNVYIMKLLVILLLCRHYLLAQLVPKNPGGHLHEGTSAGDVQVPPFRQTNV